MKKKIFTILLALAILFPQTSIAALTAVPFVATTSTATLIIPNTFNGTRPIPFAPYYIASSTTNYSVFPYASSTGLTVDKGAYFSALTTSGVFFPTMIGTTTPPLFTTGTLSPLFVYRKENTTNNVFYPVITAAENANGASVISGGGPCYSWYLGSNGTGRILSMDCTMYDNPINFIRGARINMVTDTNGNFLVTQRTDGTGNVIFGATTTLAVAPFVARVTALNPVNSTQDLYHGDQGTGLATTTNWFVKSTGAMGVATSTCATVFCVSGIVNTNFWESNNTSLAVVNGDVVWKIKVSTGDNSGLTGRDETASISAVADTADYAGVAAPTAWLFKTQDTAGALATRFFIGNGGKNAFGSTTPNANLQVTSATANATSSLELGKDGQNKGDCIKRHRLDGTAIYSYIDNTNLEQWTTLACATGL